mmetsp:Transcript_3113/g.4266  ORF Transcript_3113/g.4266 Transcript_3113/m.4266 type:complete len:578 (+) Transcript_3113:442-2175(+)
MSNNDDFASIEEELLKVTSSGDSNKRSSKKKSSKKRKSKKYSSSSSEEEGQLSQSEADETKHRKPLKKRKVGESGYSSSEEKGEYGADLVGDEEDRKYLNSLTELERERIIAERYQKRKEQQEIEELKKTSTKSKSSPSQSQPRQSKRVQSKHVALSDLRKKMQRARAGSKHSSSSSSSESESSFSESDDDYRRKKKSRERAVKSKDDSEEEFEIKEDQERQSAEDERLTLEDVNALCLKRTFLEQKCEESYFDRMVAGFFVRVGMTGTSDKRVYLLTQVVSVKELPKRYTLGSKKTNKYLTLGIGTSTKQFSMDVVSNSPVDAEEFSRWSKQMEKFKLPIMTKQQAQEKMKELDRFRNYVYTEQDINKMIEKRKKEKNLPMNLSAERARLLSLKVTAQESGNLEEVENLSKALELVEQKIKKQERKTPDKATLINQKNRELELDKSAMIDHSHSWITDPDLDPFSRRQTKSFNSFIRKDDKENSKEVQPPQKDTTHLQPQNESKQQPKKTKPSILPKADFQDPETALKNAHDFDLDKLHISAPTVKAPTVATEENVQKPTKKTLSVEDYKRRRGLV